VGKKLIKNSQPFRKKFQKTVGGIFFDSHCMGYPEDSRLKPNGEMDCGRQQYVLGRLYVQNIEVLR